jgi:hypothetical protein
MSSRGALHRVVGLAALIAPALHSVSDAIEWLQGGFSAPQLWLNYAAFLPMPWLLLGLVALHPRRPGASGLVGALLYGASFTYFAHTTLYAWSEQIGDYAALWERLGPTYTFHGAVMVCGGLLFVGYAWRAGWLPRPALRLFLAGLLVNAALGVLPSPEILQTVGSTVRNLGLMAMGYAVLSDRRLGVG